MTTTSSSAWTLADIPDQTGRTILVTGTTSGGLGHFTALELARRGGRVVLAGRSTDKLDGTESAIVGEVPDAVLEKLVVDLADLSSVRTAAEEAGELGPIDVLVNNAGVMAPPFRRTADGLESQMATNHFGPFLFTGLLLPQLVASGDARVVTVSSQMHRHARHAPVGDPKAAPPLPPLVGLQRDQAGQPALHLRARQAGAGQGPAAARHSPRTPASPAPTSRPTGSSAEVAAASRASWTPPSRRSRSPHTPGPGRA